MANSAFRRWYTGKVWDSTTTDDLRVALRRFFQWMCQGWDDRSGRSVWWAAVTRRPARP